MNKVYNNFVEEAVKAAKEHQSGGYEWQEEKRKSFVKGASFGYAFALKESSEFTLDIKDKMGALVGELKICQNGKPSFYLPKLIEEVEEYLYNL